MRKELYIKIKKNFVNFLFLGISLFLFITMLISNDSYQGPYYYVRLSFSDFLSAILSIILILGIIFCNNKILKLKLTLILVFFSCVFFALINESHLLYFGFRGAESRIIICLILNLFLLILCLFNLKLKYITMVLICLIAIFTLPNGFVNFHRLFYYHGNIWKTADLHILASYFFELILMLFALNNISTPLYRGTKNELKKLNKKHAKNKIAQEEYDKIKQLLIDIL